MLPFLGLACLISVCYCSFENYPTVTVKEGTLMGSIDNLPEGGTYYSFKGIPFAQPPVGELRFRDPLPPKSWTGIRDATKHGPVCIQPGAVTDTLTPGSEDCLFLNVYTRSLEPTAKLPVMFFIHGGAFIFGSGNSDIYGPKFFLPHGVLVVTINYRLGALGYLCLHIPEVPGNAGMKDQVAALKWVQSNIAQFGGNPNNVTIFGESAGSSCVTLHLLSLMSEGIYQKAIAQSGTCMNEWSIAVYPIDKAYRASEVLGNKSKDVNDILTSLRSAPASAFAGMTYKIMNYTEHLADIAVIFNPVVEKKFEGVEPFLTEETVNIVSAGKTNKVPLMIGYNSKEGLMFFSYEKMSAKINNTKYLVPREISQNLTEEETKKMGDRIKKYYIGDSMFSNDTVDALVDLVTDTNFAYNTIRLASYHAATQQPVYIYRFNYDTALNIAKALTTMSYKKGACHADDLFYLFYNNANEVQYKTEEKLKGIVNNLTKMWTDFAKTGNPTPDTSHGVTWELFNSTKQYMKLEEPLSVGPNPDNARVQFWNELYCESNLPCIK